MNRKCRGSYVVSWDTLDINITCTLGGILLGALATGIVGLITSRINDKKRIQTETTITFIKEFYSEDFMFHRKALWNLHQNVMRGNTDVEKIAQRFVYPSNKQHKRCSPLTHCIHHLSKFSYKKQNLTEHNHLSMYLSYLQRLAISIDKKQIDVESIKKAISDAMIWHAELSLKVCDNIERLARNTPNKDDAGIQERINLIINPARMVIDLHYKLGLSPDRLENEITSYVQWLNKSPDINKIPPKWRSSN